MIDANAYASKPLPIGTSYIGIVPLATGLMGWCPAYSIFGMNTCATKK